ncbi:MAG: hypothetical protein IBX36_00460 [Dehalococcoidia bacterium]|nr:hypothetical protein [Dehalococcoidia bacterium]
MPTLTTEERWLRANNNLRERGRGRGKQGKRIPALFRGRMLCPRCRKPMSVLQKRGSDQVYYYCRAHYCLWLQDPCTYNRFVPGTWDDEIWEEICTMLSSDAWLEQQLTADSSKAEDIEQLIRLEQVKISQARIRIGKVHEGWEKGFYNPDDVRTRIAEHQGTIAKAEAEIKGLQDQMTNKDLSTIEAELREQLRILRDRNLREAAFEEKAELIAKLGLKVLPSEDLKTRKICCRLNLARVNKVREQDGFAKVTFGGPPCTIRRTFSLAFSLSPHSSRNHGH